MFILESIDTNQTGYKFAGIINFYGSVPNLVHPIFEKNGKYFLQVGMPFIDCFLELQDESCLKRLKTIYSNLNSFNVQDYYFKGNEGLMALEDEDGIIVGNALTFLNFLPSYVTEDEEFKKCIDEMLVSYYEWKEQMEGPTRK